MTELAALTCDLRKSAFIILQTLWTYLTLQLRKSQLPELEAPLRGRCLLSLSLLLLFGNLLRCGFRRFLLLRRIFLLSGSLLFLWRAFVGGDSRWGGRIAVWCAPDAGAFADAGRGGHGGFFLVRVDLGFREC